MYKKNNKKDKSCREGKVKKPGEHDRINNSLEDNKIIKSSFYSHSKRDIAFASLSSDANSLVWQRK